MSNADRRRIQNAAGTSFFYDRANATQELSGSTVLANLLSGGVDEIFSRSDSAGALTPMKDALGSTVALADASGNLVTSYSYDPFGNTTASGTASNNGFQYTGRENEGNGVYFMRARYYSPGLHRFISQDPLGFAGSGPNLYAYAGNSPTNFTDPFGLSSGEADAALAWINGANKPLDGIYAAQQAHNLAGRKDFSWWGTFAHDLFGGWGFHSARNDGETWSHCVDRAQQSLLGTGGTYALNGAVFASAGTWAYTTPLSGPIAGPVPGTTMGPMSGWESDTFYNAGVDGVESFFTASKWAPVVSKGAGLTTAVAVGVKGGFYTACFF